MPTVYNKISGDLTPIGDHILVINMERGDRVTAGGIIITDDNGKDRGIRPRWCQVWRVGPRQLDVTPGEWILVEHGRWTWGIECPQSGGESLYVQRVEAEAVLLAANERPY